MENLCSSRECEGEMSSKEVGAGSLERMSVLWKGGCE